MINKIKIIGLMSLFILVIFTISHIPSRDCSIDPVWLGVDEKEIEKKEEKPKGFIGRGASPKRSWKITKTGDEVSLGVSYTILNDTSTEFCIDMNDKSQYEYNKYLNKDNTKEFPVEIAKTASLSTMSTYTYKSLDISTAHSGNEKCFIIHYGVDENVSLELGWDSVQIGSDSEGGALDRNTNEEIVKGSGGKLFVTYEDDVSHRSVANSSDDGVTWTVTDIGAWTAPTNGHITVNSTGGIYVFGTETDGDDAIEMYHSSDDGASWSSLVTVFSAVGDAFSLPVCVADSNDIIHCCARELLSDDVWYTNSSNWNTETAVNTDDADDTDTCDIEVDRNNDCVYIVGQGGDQDDVDIWSPCLNGWGNGNHVTVHAGTADRDPAFAIAPDGKIYVAYDDGSLQFANSSDGGSTWSNQELDATEGDYPDIAVTEEGHIYIFFELDASNTIYAYNSTDSGASWSARSTISAAYEQPAFAATSFPVSNRITDTLHYVMQDESNDDVYYESQTVQYTEESVGCTDITACTNIVSSGCYNLTSSITNGDTTNCIDIDATDVVLHCNGNTIDGDDAADFGIYIDRDTQEIVNITINDCKISQWDLEGIWVNDASKVHLNNVEVSDIDGVSTDNCIQFADSYNSTLNNVTTINCGSKGIRMYRVRDTNITTCYINDTTYGMELFQTTGNIITGCEIENSVLGSIEFDGATGNNTIYNNLLNDTIHTVIDENFFNDWNVSEQEGTRIAGSGLNIGGNYYTNSSDGGYSITCTDADCDGFCDSSLTLDTYNIDYLPLSDEWIDGGCTAAEAVTTATVKVFKTLKTKWWWN